MDNSYMNIIMPIFVLLFFMVFSFYLFYYSSRKEKAILKKLSNYFRGTVSKFSIIPSLKGEYHGLKFSISLMPKFSNSIARGIPASEFDLMISVIKNSFFKLRLYKKGDLPYDLGMRMARLRKVEINDEIFDRDFLMRSDKSTQVINYFTNNEIKNAIRELFNYGFDEFIIDGKRLSILKCEFILKQDFEPSRIISTLEKLNLLAKGV